MLKKCMGAMFYIMKKRMRIVPALLAVMLCLAMLPGCGKKKPQTEGAAAASTTEVTVEAVASKSKEAVESAASASKDSVETSPEAVTGASGTASAGGSVSEALTGASSTGAASTEVAATTEATSALEDEKASTVGASEIVSGEVKSATAGATDTPESAVEATKEAAAVAGTSEIAASVSGTSPPAGAAKSKKSEAKDSSKDAAKSAIDEAGVYTSKDDVALYIHTYGKLPSNFITKKEANALGWSGGSLEKYAPGKSIGGDKFGNYEGLLPIAKGRKYYECDIDTMGKSKRGAKRIIFSSDGLIFYTKDHYESFEQLY